jgi:hypothetical protein
VGQAGGQGGAAIQDPLGLAAAADRARDPDRARDSLELVAIGPRQPPRGSFLGAQAAATDSVTAGASCVLQRARIVTAFVSMPLGCVYGCGCRRTAVSDAQSEAPPGRRGLIVDCAATKGRTTRLSTSTIRDDRESRTNRPPMSCRPNVDPLGTVHARHSDGPRPANGQGAHSCTNRRAESEFAT